MAFKDPLSFMVHRIQPCGFTTPGRLPAARLNPQSGLVAQHHEALHHHFNSITTVGNGLALLCQLSRECPPPLSSLAMEIADHWTGAIVYELEGLINYVCMKRVMRRFLNYTTEEYEHLLTKNYRRAWINWKRRYDSLEIEDRSKDALAMHVGGFVLNIPVYHGLKNLKTLDRARNMVSEEVVSQRFTDVAREVDSPQGRKEIVKWNVQMQELWSQRLSEASLQRAESEAAIAMLRRLVPNIESVPTCEITQSVQIANSWNNQLTDMGYTLGHKIQMTESDYVDSMTEVVIFPPTPSLSCLYPCERPSTITDFLQSQPESYGLVIVHQEKKGFVLSKKYNRELKKGQVYLRCSFSKPTPKCDRYDIPDLHLFAILSVEEFKSWIRIISHPNLIITNSHASEDLMHMIVENCALDSNQLWQFHWGEKIEPTLDFIKRNQGNIKWIKTVLMVNSKSAFWLAKFDDHQHLDVYPVPWEFRDALIHQLRSLYSFGPPCVDDRALYAILGLIMNVGF